MYLICIFVILACLIGALAFFVKDKKGPAILLLCILAVFLISMGILSGGKQFDGIV